MRELLGGRPGPGRGDPLLGPLLLVAALSLLAAPGCSDDSAAGSQESRVGEFPAEPGPADFPGVRYPVAAGPLPRPGAAPGPLWLIGIDGATWDVMRPMLERGELPNFADLIAGGAHGTLVSEDPTISPAVWATIATGMPRFEHGIVNFLVRQPGTYETREAGPPDRRSPALWELVGAAGGTSAVLSWFGSYPVEQIPGYYVAKRFDPENLERGQVHPEAFMERLATGAVVRMRRGDLEGIGWTQDLREALVHDARTLAALRVVAAESRPELVVAYFAGIDVAQHLTWRHMQPETQTFPEDGSPDADLAGVIPSYYRYLDHTLGEIRALAPEGTTFLVVSDHGAGPIRLEQAFLLQLPVFLETVGLMRGTEGPLFSISELYRHEKRIWLNLAGVEPGGILPQAEAHERADEMAERLGRMVTDGGDPVFASIVDHTDEPDWQPGDAALTVRFSRAAQAAAKVVDGAQEYDLSQVRLRFRDVSGSHRPEGILIAHGPAIRAGALPEPASIYHVAPTALYLLGLPQDARMLRLAPAAGGVLEAALDPDALRRRPVEMIERYTGTDRTHLLRANVSAAPTDPAHPEALESLRSLGYVR